MDEKGKIRFCGRYGRANVRYTDGQFWDCVEFFNLIAGKPDEGNRDGAGHQGGEN